LKKRIPRTRCEDCDEHKGGTCKFLEHKAQKDKKQEESLPYIAFAEDYLTNPYQPHIPGYPPQKLFWDEETDYDGFRLRILEELELNSETKDKIQIALLNFLCWINREKEKGLLKHSQRRDEQRKEIIKHLDEVVKRLEALNDPSLQMHSHILPPLSKKIGDWRYIQRLKDELSILKEEQNRDGKDYHPQAEREYADIVHAENAFVSSDPKLDDVTLKKLSIFTEKQESFLNARYTRPKGKPEEFYFKALQFVVFNLLHKDGRLPKTKAYESTAAIINEAYQKQGPDFTDVNGVAIMEEVEVPGSPSDNEDFPELAARRKKRLPDKVTRSVILYKKDPQYHNLTDRAVEHTVTGK
jgi:hypothetical protein